MGKPRSIPDPSNVEACLSALREIAILREGWKGSVDSTGKTRERFLSFEALVDLLLNNREVYNAILHSLETVISTERLNLLERSADPPEPENGKGVIWLSDGTGKGDDGDVMIAVNVDGTTLYGTLFDYSGGAAW